MSLWKRLKDRLGVGADAPEDAAPSPPAIDVPAVAPPRPADRFALLRKELAGPQEEAQALDLLASARGTPEETEALSALVTRSGPLPEALALAGAELFVLRGQEDRALELLTGARSASALMMQADLHASRGDLARAIGSIERVLAKAIDTPRAMERRER